MNKHCIGLLKEHKTPPESRVAFLPDQCRKIQRNYPEIAFSVQSYAHRCVPDQDYSSLGIDVNEDLKDCAYLFGIKEMAIDSLIPGATYFTFSHTAKEQPYNRNLLRAILKKKVTLVDYEYLKNTKGKRVVAFGRFAGIVGAWNGLIAYMKKHYHQDLPRARDLGYLEKLLYEAERANLPAMRICITGTGRVAQGAKELLEQMGFCYQSPQIFKKQNEEEDRSFTLLSSEDYYAPKSGGSFDRAHFREHPEDYTSNLEDYLNNVDLLIGAAYWDHRAPRHFQLEDLNSKADYPSVIADISCDIHGGFPTTVRASTVAQPFYDIDKSTGQEQAPFSSKEHITVMAIDNLPSELPYDASLNFGEQLRQHIIPRLVGKTEDKGMIENATIAKNGQLTKHFAYLQDFVEGGG